MPKQVPWDEDTEEFVSDLDDIISKKYGMTLRNLLLNPSKYTVRPGAAATIADAKQDVHAYFDSLLEGLKDEQSKLQSEMELADSQYAAVDSVITEKAAAARVPYIRPMYVSRQREGEEVVLIERYDESLEPFVGKLVNASNYVADVSATYKTYRLGSWLFSGAKNHVLTINPPASPVLAIESSRDTINGLLDAIVPAAPEQ
jgi:hypothetical protein